MLNLNAARVIGQSIIKKNRLDRRLAAEDSLIGFVKELWHVCEPAIPFIEGWAISAIAEHLQAVTEGQIKRLLMNVPPGFTKSLLTDVFWPAWEWGPKNLPHYRYVCASYSNHLTERDNMRCRNVVISERYQEFWGHRFKIANDQFTKVKFANNKTGWKLATSVSGIGVGERGDRFIIDDPNNTMEMESETVRDTAKMWFTEVVPDRLNNPQESAIVVIQQRLHEDDISGIAIAREMGYTHLMIPMRHDVTRHCTTEVISPSQGNKPWEDPRDEDGELAWPERFTEEVCDNMERDKGPYAWSGQYQQYPVPRGGAILKEEYWQLWDQERLPNFEFIVASLDPAFTEKDENDPSAFTVWGVFRDDVIKPTDNRTSAWAQEASRNPKIMLLWAWEERLQFTDLLEKVLDSCIPVPGSGKVSFPVDRLLIEAKGSGQSVGQELCRLIRGTGKFGVELIDPKKYGDKWTRVNSIEHMFRDQMIYAPDRSWADKVIRQCGIFPKGSHDDLVDTTSQAMRWLRDMGFALRREEYSLELEQETAYDTARGVRPLYPV